MPKYAGKTLNIPASALIISLVMKVDGHICNSWYQKKNERQTTVQMKNYFHI